jgi:hypothetical protein
VARLGERRVACRVLVGKPEGRSPLGRPMLRWVNNIKRILLEYVGAWTGLMWLKWWAF